MHTTRHEAAHAVMSWITGVPFDRLTVVPVPGTGFSGHMEGNSNAVHWARAQAAGSNAVSSGILVRLIASMYVAELVDIQVNLLPAAIAAARAGAPAPGREINGDYLNVQNELDGWRISQADRVGIEVTGKTYANSFVVLPWFRTAVIAVGDRLLAQPTMLDIEVESTVLGTFPVGTPNPAPPEPPRDDIELAAYYRYLNTGSVPGNDLIHWHSVRKGLRFWRACGG